MIEFINIVSTLNFVEIPVKTSPFTWIPFYQAPKSIPDELSMSRSCFFDGTRYSFKL